MFNRSDAVDFGGDVSGTGILEKKGGGVLTLSGTNSHSGGTFLSAGTLSVSNNNQLGRTTGTPGELTFNGGTLRVTGTSFTSTGSRAVTMTGAGTFEVTEAANSLSLGGAISGVGSLTKTGAGTLVLTQASTSFTGNTYLVGGTLSASSNNQLGRTNNNPPDLYFNGGTLRVTGTSFTNLGTGNNTRVVNWQSGGGGFDIAAANNTFTVANALTGTGGLTKSGLGTLTLSGANTYSGGTTISAGTLKASAATRLSAFSAFTVGAAGTLDIGGFSQSIGSLSGAAGAIVTNSGASGSARITAGGDNSSTSFAGVIRNGSTATTALTKTGTGTLTLTGTNTYSGGTTISGGTLQIGDGSTTGAIAGDVSTGITGASGTLAFNRSDDLVYGGIVSGAGALAKRGAGILTLSGVSDYTGGTTISAGTLVVGDAGHGSASLAGAVEVRANATLAGIGSIGGAVTVADGGTLAPGNSPGTLTVGALLLSDTSQLAFELDTPGVVGGGINDLIVVTGGLTLDGQLSLTPMTDFGTGSYRLFNYGSLTQDNGLVLVSGPVGYNFEVVTGANRVNLVVNYDGLQFWNGGTLAADGTVHGGPGTWNNTDTNWTDVDGALTQNWVGLTAVFSGASGGTVTVSEDVAVAGLQFGVGGYALTGAGKIVISATDTAAIGNEITGTGGLFKTSEGTLVLTGTNSYSGGTVLAAGRLEVSSDGNLGAASGGLSFTGGTLATTASFDTARAVTLDASGALDVATGTMLGLTGTVTGAGGLTKDGFGTLVLSGANTYQGGTVLEDGILQVATDANLGAASGGLTFSGGMLATSASFASARDVTVATLGGFDVAAGTQLDLSGAISGAGTLAKLGAGALALSGMSAADWNVQAGDLTANAADFFGNVAISSGAGFTFHQPADAAYAATISGSGAFTKAGSGALNLTGDSAGFAGTTTVAAGLMSVNGSLGGTLDVLVGGTLGGIGTVGTTTISGTVAPGNSVGTLNVAGDVTFNPGSTYEVEILGNGTSDVIAATGQAFIKGGTVEVIALDPQTSYQNGQSYIILTAAGGISGAFDAAVSDSIFLDVSAQDLLNGVNLTIAVKGDEPTPHAPPSVFERAAATPNQFATAVALDTLPQAGASLALYNALLFLTSEAEAQYAFDQLSGEAYASAKGLFIEQSGLVRTAMIDRLRPSFGAVASSAAPVMAYAAPSGPGASEAGMALKAAAAPATTEAFAMWASGFGAWGEMDGNGNAAGLSSATGGFLIGADATLGAGWRVGLTGGYSYTDFDIDARNSSGNSENWHVGVYGGNQWGPLGLRTGLAYSWHDVETSRAVGFTGFGDYLDADYDAATFQAFGELGYRIDTAFAAFEPFANLAYVSLHTDGFTEQGGDAALTGTSSTTDTSFTTLGLRAPKTVLLGSAETTLRGALGWRHAFGDITPLATQSFFGSQSFTVAGTPIAEDAALIEAGLDVLIGASTTLGVAYAGQFGDGLTQNGFNATRKVSF